jgi:hypothetical protein
VRKEFNYVLHADIGTVQDISTNKGSQFVSAEFQAALDSALGAP